MNATPKSSNRELRAVYSDLNGAHDWMASICGPHALRVSRPQGLNFHQSGAMLCAMSTTLGLVEYGTDVTVAVRKEEPLDCYSLSLPLVGEQELDANGRLWLSDQDRGIIVSPDETQDLTIAGNCRKIHVAIPRDAIQRVLETMLRRPIDAPVIFHPEMDAAAGDQASWWRMVKFLVNELAQSSPRMVNFYMSTDFELALLKSLLLSQPNNYSGRLSDTLNQPAPHYIARARRFIHDNVREPITLDDIERFAGVSRNKLFSGFRQHLGCTPMAYLKRHRLESVRQSLLEDQSVLNVSSIAMNWGVTHLGRFSMEYKEAFGESPSETLKRCGQARLARR